MNPIRKFKALHTPPCSECIHRCGKSIFGLTEKCSCPMYLDYYERKSATRYRSADASLVRGTRWCKFEQAEEVAL